MTFCLLVCQMCGKGTFSQIRSQMVSMDSTGQAGGKPEKPSAEFANH